MKSYALIVAATLFVGMTGAAYAECDTHKGDRDTDKQTACSEKCEDSWTAHRQNYFADVAKLKEDAVACFEKCGCAEHGAKFLSR
ncbi:MAG TPA: hypothetical protein VEH76_07570 [Methylocystis sp.]|nr:hypothetical protein [Methylocystis sp.]